jgi:hypothetical protein
MSAPEIIASLEKNSRERVRVALDEYQGVKLIDIRITTELSQGTGIQAPTKKGVALNVAKLPELIDALQQAERRARELGLIASVGERVAA